MKLLKKSFCILLALLMLFCLTACKENEDLPSSDLTESAQPTPTPTPEPTPQPESTPFTPAEDLIPPSSDIDEDDPFEQAFSQNPIDKEYDEAYGRASSFSMMQQACDEAAKNWKDLIDDIYPLAMDALPQEEQADLEVEQNDWLAGLDAEVEAIRAEAPDTNEGALSSAKAIVLLYRERAKALCETIYKAHGALPEFPDLSNMPAG